ncbi:MAG: CPBP family intramembrane metalloprotease [Phycisphaeraceae bacterium]|nr:MAG: CPBP family intramembrane metalloprotease [Phycisphaeraceae bacterium]
MIDAPTGAAESEPPPLGGIQRIARWVEMIGLFFVLPAVAALIVDPARRAEGLFQSIGLGALFDLPFATKRLLLPLLLLFTVAVVAWLMLDRTFDRRQLWNTTGLRREWRRVATLFVPGAVLMLAVAWAADRFLDMPAGFGFLSLPRHHPLWLVIITIFYPWLSAYPQEISHRTFFFHRYGSILGPASVLIAVNALAFAWLHAPFWNLWAFALTLPGGILFAWTYARSRSTLAATVEHAAYGWWAFFTGLGWFLYTGSIGS